MSVVINGSAGVTTNSGAVYNGISAGTAVASTSGTSIDFTSIPSWVKRVTVMFNGVSTNGTSAVQVQIGTSGGIENTGYSTQVIYITGSNACSLQTYTTGIGTVHGLAASARTGLLILANVSGNIWSYSGNVGDTSNGVVVCVSGNKTLSGTLDRVRITTVNGTDTFDAGSINILYE